MLMLLIKSLAFAVIDWPVTAEKSLPSPNSAPVWRNWQTPNSRWRMLSSG